MADHIQIGDIAPRIQYTGDGVQTAFTFPFPIFETSDLEVYLDKVQQTTGFSISGAGASSGGSVTFDVAPSVGTLVTIRRFMAIQRTTDFQEGGTFLAKTINDELDRQAAFSQQIEADLERSLRLDPTDPAGDLIMPLKADRSGYALAFDADGDPVPSNLTLAALESGSVDAAASAQLAETAKVAAETAKLDAETAQAGAVVAEGNAAASANSAAAIANAQMFRAVTMKSAADSPISISEVDNGTLFIIDTSAGAVMVTLPGAASLSALPFNIAVLKTTSDANTITLDPGSTDTIDGSATWVLAEDQEAVAIVADISGTPDDWQVVRFGIPLQDGTVTKEKLADGAKAYDVAFYAGYDQAFVAENIGVQTYAKFIAPRAITLEGVTAKIETAPTGAALIFDVLKNGVSVFSTKPEIAASNTALTTSGGLSTTSVVAGDVISFVVDQVGSTVRGAGCVFSIKGRIA